MAAEDGMDRIKQIEQIIDIVDRELREKESILGSVLGGTVRREIPNLNLPKLGYPSLSALLRVYSNDFVIIGRSGEDVVWSLSSHLSEHQIEDATYRNAEGEVYPQDAIDTLKSIQLQNLRACRDTQLTLEPSGLTVLVGPNGAGKTTLLRGIFNIAQLIQLSPQVIFSGSRALSRLRTSKSDGAVVLKASTWGGDTLLIQGTTGADETQFRIELKTEDNQGAWVSPGFSPDPPLRRRRIGYALWPAVVLRFNPDALAAPSKVTEDEPRLDSNGYGLPSVLAHLANNDPERLAKVIAGVQQIVPSVLRTRQRTRNISSDKLGYQLEVEMKDLGWVPADLLSEGTLFAFGIHAVLQQSHAPRLLLMDDLDRGLHPRAQRRLVRQLIEVSQQKKLQIVVSTHSPYVLDELSAEAIRVVRTTTNGGTVVRKLTEHQEWEAFKDAMSPGEFWSYVGEDWLEAVP